MLLWSYLLPYPQGLIVHWNRTFLEMADDRNPSVSSDTDTRTPPSHGLVRIALPLLVAAGLLRATRQVPDPATLQGRLREALQEFRLRAVELGYSPVDVDKAGYALCALVDENALGTPWGSTGWGVFALLKEEYAEPFGGDRFFTDLNQVLERDQADTDLLELMYLCLSLGFDGRFRRGGYNQARNEVLRRDLLRRLVRQAPSMPSVDRRGRRRSRATRPTGRPLWLAWTLAGLLLLAAFKGFQTVQEEAARPLIEGLQEIARPPQTTDRADGRTVPGAGLLTQGRVAGPLNSPRPLPPGLSRPLGRP